LDELTYHIACYCIKKGEESVNGISKKYFRPDGIAPSEWTCSVRAFRDTLVADISVTGRNTTPCITYRPLIAVSPFLLTLSVTYFK
jgi:hypothetical protein